jgi:hypothetical protein
MCGGVAGHGRGRTGLEAVDGDIFAFGFVFTTHNWWNSAALIVYQLIVWLVVNWQQAYRLQSGLGATTYCKRIWLWQRSIEGR